MSSAPRATKAYTAEVSAKTGSMGELVMRLILKIVFFAYFIESQARRAYRKASYALAGSSGYHHRSPQLIRQDVSQLSKVPEHVAVILDLLPVSAPQGGIQGLLHQTGEITGWCIGAGSRVLTIYERTGALQQLPLQDTLRQIKQSLEGYFGVDGVPPFEVRRSNREPIVYPSKESQPTFCVNLLSEKDGRAVIVQLAGQLSEFAKENKIKPEDITVNFVDQEMQQLVGREPDLLVMFSPRVDLQGFPPWHVRVSEIFHLPDNTKPTYLVFKCALEKFSGSKINLGK